MAKKAIQNLFDMFERESHSLWLVGGLPRDLLFAQMWDNLDTDPNCDLNVASIWNGLSSGHSDADFATSATPEETIETLKKNGFKVIPIGIEFGTIQTILSSASVSLKMDEGQIVEQKNVHEEFKVEITTFRSSESYTKGSRKPTVKFGTDIKNDLSRRDLSINAIAMDRNMNPLDPFGGFNDLVTGVLETPLDPETSFGDDPLRMLRVCRFVARGFGGIGWRTGEAMEKMNRDINTVSKERIVDEITKLLVAKNPIDGLGALERSGLLREVLPEVQILVNFKTKGKSKNLWDHVTKVVSQTPNDPVLRWAALMHDIGKPAVVRDLPSGVTFQGHETVGAKIWEQIAARLKMSNDFTEKVAFIVRESGSLVDLKNSAISDSGLTDKAIRRFIRKTGPHLDRVFQFTMADMTTKHKWKIEEMKKETTELMERVRKVSAESNVTELKLPKFTGNLLMNSLNLKGKDLGDMMEKLTQMLVDGDLTTDSDFVKVVKEIIDA